MDANIGLVRDTPTEYRILTVADLKARISDIGLWPVSCIVPGTVVLVQSASHQGAFISRAIAGTQKRALKQLMKKLGMDIDPEVIEFYAKFTHAGIVGSPQFMYHMTFPRAERQEWEKLRGQKILVRGLKGIDVRGCALHDVAKQATADIEEGEPYDWRDLLGFWIRWNTYLLGPKLHFHKVFGSKRHDVCSTRVIEWYMKAGVLPESYRDRKWSYYPAHLAMSSEFETVGYYEVT